MSALIIPKQNDFYCRVAYFTTAISVFPPCIQTLRLILQIVLLLRTQAFNCFSLLPPIPRVLGKKHLQQYYKQVVFEMLEQPSHRSCSNVSRKTLEPACKRKLPAHQHWMETTSICYLLILQNDLSTCSCAETLIPK